MAMLQKEAQRIGGMRLLVVDPVVSAVAGDSHKNGDVRRALQPLVDLARSLDVAVLGISHFSKGGGSGADPVSRVVGSIAFTAVARVLLIAASVRGGSGGMGPIGPTACPQPGASSPGAKATSGRDDGGFEYQIEQLPGLPGLPDVAASRMFGGQAVSGSARELLPRRWKTTTPAQPKERGRGRRRLPARVPGRRPSAGEDGDGRGDKAGVSWASIRRASDHLCVIKSKGGASGHWFWKLPKKLS